MAGRLHRPAAEGNKVSDGPDDDERKVAAGLGRKVRGTLGKVPFARDAVAAFYAARDPATPRHVKAGMMAALAYFIMPVDLVPDFLAGLGYTDDATVFFAAWRLLAPHLKDEHHERATDFLSSGSEEIS